MRHFMFKNTLGATDPVTVAQGFDLPPPPPITDQTHTYYYSLDAYLAPCDLVLASAETITVHFNAPISVRWMKSEEQIDKLDEQHLTLAVTNKGTEPVFAEQNNGNPCCKLAWNQKNPNKQRHDVRGFVQLSFYRKPILCHTLSRSGGRDETTHRRGSAHAA